MAPAKLTIIDDSLRPDHWWLEDGDHAAFIYEYISGAGFAGDPGNNLIFNIKMSPALKGQNRYFYKNRDITRAAGLLTEALDHDFLLDVGTAVIPAPPSKMPDHPEYDDRIFRICDGLRRNVGKGVDVRELIRIAQSREAQSHGARLKVPDMIATMRINEAVVEPAPRRAVIVDDVLTNGTTFKAMQTMLRTRFPGVEVFGVFLARVKRPDHRISGWLRSSLAYGVAALCSGPALGWRPDPLPSPSQCDDRAPSTCERNGGAAI